MSRRPADAPSLFSDSATPPPENSTWINAHCDGGARGNPGPAGYGALIQDDQGMVLAELSEFLGMRTNNYAEYSGLLACLQYALDHHHPRLRVVSDSELMVKQIQGKYKVSSPDLRPLWQEARNRIAKLEAFQISHALRHKNKDADRLANEAMDRGMKRPHAPGQPAPPPLKATPYPTKAEAPPDPYAKAGVMLRGFTKDGVVHILGNATLPDGVFVKIIRE
jgi:ribonuclease HI